MNTPRLFSLRATARRVLTATIQPAAFALLLAHAHAGNTWDGGGGDDNWSTGANWNPDGAPGYGTLTFSGATRTTNFNDSITAMNILLWSGTSSWVMNGSATLSLFDFGGGQAKIENQSSGSVTINAPITFAANNGAPPNPFGEINAVNGDITFASSTLTVNGSSVNGIKFWGGAGRTVNFNSTVSASGKWFGITSGAGTSITIGTSASVTVGDVYVMNNGTLKLAGGTLTTSAVRLGGDFGNTGNQNQAQGGTLALTSATGGISFGGTINSVTSNTSNALLIDSQNTSGTNTLSGGVFLDSDLAIQQTAGGALSFAGVNSIDVKIRKLTVGGAGDVSIAEVLGSSFGAGGFLVKEGVGTLILANTANTYTGTSTATLNANGTQIAGGTLGIHGDGSLGLAPAGAYNNIQFTGSSTLQDTANDISLHANRNISIAAAATATLDNNGNTFTVGGIINGATGNLATTGGGAVVLTGANTYGGSTAINGGTLQLGSGGTSGSIENTSGITVAGGATLAVNRSDTLTISQVIQGAGGLRKLGSGTLVLDAANTYAGGTEIDEGIVRVGAIDSLPVAGAITLANNASALLDLDGFNQTIGSLSGGGATGGNVHLGAGTLTVGDTTSTIYGGVISGDGGSLVKQGSGVLTLTNSSTYTGSTTINAGAIRSGTNNALPTGTALTLADAASALFDLDGFDQTIGSLSGGGASGGTVALGSGTLTVGDANSTTFAGTITGTGGSLVKVGDGTLTLGGSNSYSGSTSINAGLLNVSASDNLGNGSATNTLAIDSGTLLVTGTFDLGSNRSLAIGGFGATIEVAGSNELTLSGSISGGMSGTLAKTGAGRLILTGTNTNSGYLDIQGGAIRASSSANLGNGTFFNGLQFTGGRLEATGTFSTGARFVDFGVDGGTFDVAASHTLTVPGGMTGIGALRKDGAGTLALAGSSSLYVGLLLLNAGTLSAGSNASLGDESSGTNTLVFNGGTLEATASFDLGALRSVGINSGGGTFNVAGGSELNVSGAINGSAGIAKSGAGTLTLSGSNTTFSGALSIASGTLRASSSDNLGNGVASNSLTLAGSTLNSTASFDFGSSRTATLGAGGGTFDVDSGTTLTLSGFVTGSGSLTKSGEGTLVVSGSTNDYTGDTFINAGTLSITNIAGSATGTGDLTIGNGGTLAGDGAISGGVTVNNGGAISPGNSIGAIELGALTLEDGAHLTLEIDTTALVSDTFAITNLVPADGDLTLNGTVTLDITDIDPGTLGLHDAIVFATYTGERLGSGFFRVPGFNYDLLDYTGEDPSAVTFLLGSTPVAIDYDYNNTKTIAFVVVPEPSALAALAGGTGLLLGLRRLRRRTA